MKLALTALALLVSTAALPNPADTPDLELRENPAPHPRRLCARFTYCGRHLPENCLRWCQSLGLYNYGPLPCNGGKSEYCCCTSTYTVSPGPGKGF